MIDEHSWLLDRMVGFFKQRLNSWLEPLNWVIFYPVSGCALLVEQGTWYLVVKCASKSFSYDSVSCIEEDKWTKSLKFQTFTVGLCWEDRVTDKFDSISLNFPVEIFLAEKFSDTYDLPSFVDGWILPTITLMGTFWDEGLVLKLPWKHFCPKIFSATGKKFWEQKDGKGLTK